MVILGGKYKDMVTDVEGFATAQIEYYCGSVSVRLEWQDKDGEVATAWMEESRLVPADLTERP